jgi:hypothetical protein
MTKFIELVRIHISMMCDCASLYIKESSFTDSCLVAILVAREMLLMSFFTGNMCSPNCFRRLLLQLVLLKLTVASVTTAVLKAFN